LWGMGGWRRVRVRRLSWWGVRGEYGFSSLMKQNKKGKNCAVFCFAGKRKIFLIYLWSDYMGKKKKKLCYSLLRGRGENL
jgi:hypothetical protein